MFVSSSFMEAPSLKIYRSTCLRLEVATRFVWGTRYTWNVRSCGIAMATRIPLRSEPLTGEPRPAATGMIAGVTDSVRTR